MWSTAGYNDDAIITTDTKSSGLSRAVVPRKGYFLALTMANDLSSKSPKDERHTDPPVINSNVSSEFEVVKSSTLMDDLDVKSALLGIMLAAVVATGSFALNKAINKRRPVHLDQDDEDT